MTCTITPRKKSRMALAEQLCAALSDDAEDAGAQEGADGTVSFWVQGTNRDFDANGPALQEAFRIAGPPAGKTGAEQNDAWISFISAHNQPSSEGHAYSLIFQLPSHQAVLVVTTTLGEYTDDDFDLYLAGDLSFAEGPVTVEDLTRRAQQACIRRLLDYLAHTLTSAVCDAPAHLLTTDDPLLLGQLADTVNRQLSAGVNARGGHA